MSPERMLLRRQLAEFTAQKFAALRILKHWHDRSRHAGRGVIPA
jgi:hypothetical protein